MSWLMGLSVADQISQSSGVEAAHLTVVPVSQCPLPGQVRPVSVWCLSTMVSSSSRPDWSCNR